MLLRRLGLSLHRCCAPYNAPPGALLWGMAAVCVDAQAIAAKVDILRVHDLDLIDQVGLMVEPVQGRLPELP